MKLHKKSFTKLIAVMSIFFFFSTGTILAMDATYLHENRISDRDDQIANFDSDMSTNNDHGLQVYDEIDESKNQLGNSNTVVLLETNFEKDWTSQNHYNYLAPPGWEIQGISSSHHQSAPYKTHYFSKINKNDAPELVHSGNASVGIWWKEGNAGSGDSGVTQDEWLISPPINIKNLHNIQLSFWSIYCPTQSESMPFYVEYKVDNSYAIKVSFDDGITWRTIADLRDSAFKLGVDLTSDYVNNDFGNGGFFNHPRLRGDFFNMYDELVVIPISFSESERSRSDYVRIAWHYHYNSSGAQALWIIDDVQITASYDYDTPTVNFLHPRKNSLYLGNARVNRLMEQTIIVGAIDLEVDARDYETGVKSVQFFIDGRLRRTVRSRPFTWSWDDSTFGRHTIMVKAADFAGNVETQQITVWKFF